MLLQACKEVGASMLVMGAFERSKLSEDIFGGVTAEVLKKTHLPVFLSH